MRIEQSLRLSAQRFGAKTALIAGDDRLTYCALDLLSDALGATLRALGVGDGDRILFLSDNRIEAVVGFFGAWKAGAVPCPLSPSIKPDKLRTIIESIQPAVVLAQARCVPAIEAALEGAAAIPIKIILDDVPPPVQGHWRGYGEIIERKETAPPVVLEGDDVLGLLIHTSGSTGAPKGVMLSHANLQAACTAITGYLCNTADDIVLSVLPLFFGYGITQVLTMIAVGGTLVLERSFAFPRKTLERLAQVEATGFPIVPTMAALVTGMKDLQPGFLPRLRYISSAAAAMPVSVSERLRHLFPETQLFLMYGQTECIRATFLPPEDAGRLPHSVGKAIPGTKAFVLDEKGEVAAPGVVGELVVEGPHVMMGYWQDPALSEEKLAPAPCGRRLQTGDLFKTDADGFLYFVSRRDDIIKTRGEKVSPQEVEQVLYALPGIREAAVGGVDDPILGQVVRAYVALEPEAQLTERDILRHCTARLEDYMVPKSVEFRQALPRTPTGKIRLTAEPSGIDIKDSAA